MNPIGIMQGRLTPAPSGRAQAFPSATWQQEFEWARQIGFDCLEWLVTAADVDANPIWTERGLAEIRECIERSGVSVRTICADCFIHERDARVKTLCRLITRAAALGAKVVIVPVLEESALASVAEAPTLARALQPAVDIASALDMVMAIESDADSIAAIVSAAASPHVAACYDVGNAAAAGASVREDVRRLGAAIAAVHIKDRRGGGASTGLGDGDADFAALFDGLADSAFDGPLILETPRGDDPVSSARANLAFVTNGACAKPTSAFAKATARP